MKQLSTHGLGNLLAAVCTGLAFTVSIYALRPATDRPEPTTQFPFPTQLRIGYEAEGYESEGRPRIGEDIDARARWELRRLADPLTGRIPDNIRQRELAYANVLPRAIAGFGKNATQQWVLRGPRNVGGRTRALGVDRRNTNIVIAAGVTGGVWRSTDGGATWTEATVGENGISIAEGATCITQDPRPGREDTWYLGRGERLGSASAAGAFYGGNGIYKSTDNGLTWVRLASTASNELRSVSTFDVVHQIVVDPSSSGEGTVYAAAFGRIMRSTNGGNTWEAVLGTSSDRITDVAVTSTGVVYATVSGRPTDASTTLNGIYRSATGADGSFTNITPADWPSGPGFDPARVVIGIAPSNQNIVYFLGRAAGTGATGTILYRYTYSSGNGAGAGGTWSNRTANLPKNDDFAASDNADVGGFNPQGGYNLIVSVRPNDPNFVLIGGTNLYRSTDGFATSIGLGGWIGGYNRFDGDTDPFIWPNHHPDQHAVVWLDNDRILSGSDGGVARSANITTVINTNAQAAAFWTDLTVGYFTSQFYTVAINPVRANDNVVMGGMQDNSTFGTSATDVNTNWIDLLGGDGSYCAIAADNANFVVSAQNAQIFRLNGTINNVTGFANLTPPQLSPNNPSPEDTVQFITPFVLDPNAPALAYLISDRNLWRNPNIRAASPAQSWLKLTGTRFSTHGEFISTLAVSTVPANRVYYGTSNGDVYRLDNANVGTGSPVKIDGGTMPNAYVSCIAVDPSDANRILVVFSNYNVRSVFYTENANDPNPTWRDVSGNLEGGFNGADDGPSARWASILPRPNGGRVFFVGTSVGLFSTTDISGTNPEWALEGAGQLRNAIINMVVSRPADGLVVAATHGRGMYSAIVTDDPTQEEPGGGTGSCNLASNQFGACAFPNAFNGSTVLQYNLTGTSDVSIRVVDAVGKVVLQRNLGRQAPGLRSQTIDAGTWASGLYLCEVSASTGQKVVLRLVHVR